MGKRVIKTTALVVAIMMLLTLFGCGSGTSSTGTSSSASGTASSSAESTAPAAKEKVTLKIYGSALATELTPGVQSDPIAKYIEDKLGVVMDLNSADGPDYATKLAAFVASGDLPDLFFIPGTGEQTMVLNSNSAYDCTELVKTNGKDMLNIPIVNASIELSKKDIGNGKLFFLNLQNGGAGSPTFPTVVPQIRWDLYKAMGYPKCDTWDELLNVLAEMQKKYPTTPDGKKTWGMSFFTDWGDWGVLYGQMMLGYEPTGVGLALDLDDYSKLLPNLTDKNSTYWQMAKIYNKAKQMGILDPDSVTQKYDQYIAKAKSGQSLFIITGWDRDTAYVGKPEEGFMGVPIINNGKFVAAAENSLGGRKYAISATSKYPDRVMDLINFLCTPEGAKTITNGVKGQTWDTIDGVDTYKPEIESVFLANKNEDVEWKKKTGIGQYRLFCGLAGSYKDETGNYIDIKLGDAFQSKQAALNPKLQDFMKHYNYKTPGEPWYKVKNWSYEGAYNSGSVLPDDLKAIQDKINDYKNSKVYKVILAKDDAEFSKLQDAFIKDLQDMGLESLTKWYVDEWAKSYPKIKALLGQ